jgi:hypothetical protein
VTAAKAAVSARKMRGAKLTLFIKGKKLKKPISCETNPPSRPTKKQVNLKLRVVKLFCVRIFS